MMIPRGKGYNESNKTRKRGCVYEEAKRLTGLENARPVSSQGNRCIRHRRSRIVRKPSAIGISDRRTAAGWDVGPVPDDHGW
ncbi:hypothetical protein [Paenibacillus sp. PL91]|uniref:hypothetical protein n=1 Tax=Paenibacillus sp. PL91 TaxID=2729538 RepID=UPI001CB9D473|nr:hypothetical protein [Paenibacillus sp. PL91]